MLERKENVLRAQKKQADKIRDLREGYRKFVKSEAGQHYIQRLDSVSSDYLTSAMRVVSRDEKATLIDSASGIMKARGILVDMSAPARSGGKKTKGHSVSTPPEQTS